jgi:Lar family restriction alleviation protein
MNNKVEIKTCPFCGGESELIIEPEWSAYVRCNLCGSEGAYFNDNEIGHQMAIESWNKRV